MSAYLRKLKQISLIENDDNESLNLNSKVHSDTVNNQYKLNN